MHVLSQVSLPPNVWLSIWQQEAELQTESNTLLQPMLLLLFSSLFETRDRISTFLTINFSLVSKCICWLNVFNIDVTQIKTETCFF